MDPTGNSLGLTGQTPLTVTNNVPGVNGLSQNKEADFNMTIKMPANFTCIGGKTLRPSVAHVTMTPLLTMSHRFDGQHMHSPLPKRRLGRTIR